MLAMRPIRAAWPVMPTGRTVTVNLITSRAAHSSRAGSSPLAAFPPTAKPGQASGVQGGAPNWTVSGYPE